MTTLLAIVLALALSAPADSARPASPAAPPSDSAQAVIRQAIDAMGGEARLRSVRALKLDAIGHSYWIDQSERPEGPWVTQYEQRTELRDLAAGRLRQTIEVRSDQSPAWTGSTLIVSDGAAAMLTPSSPATPGNNATPSNARPGRPAQVDTADASLALGPERILLTAHDAADATLGPEEVVQNVRQQVVQFTWKQARVRVVLNAYTHLPTAIELIHDDPRGIWGEVTDRTLVSDWTLESNGLLYPRQWNMEWNGTPIAALSITSFTPNPPIDADAFTIAADVRAAFAKAPRGSYRTMKLGQGAQEPQTLAEGVVQVRGPWNVTLVRQPDGLVIIEAPISSEYSTQVLEEAAHRFPGVPVKAVISTSDAWPHLSGLREYVARGIPIYAFDLNRPIIDRLLKARYRVAPDRLATAPATPKFHAVAEKTTVGEGPNRVVIFPIHGENGERMLMVFLPERRLLYTSDDIIKMRSGEYFMPSFLVDSTAAVARAGITSQEIDTAFGMHLAPTPWTEILDTLRRLRPEAPPASAPAAAGQPLAGQPRANQPQADRR